MNIKRSMQCLLIPLIVFLNVTPSAAQAIGDREYQHAMSASGTVATGYYLQNTNQFGSQKRFSGASGISVLGESLLNSDTYGDSTTVVNISPTGEVLGGRHTWIGGSDTLGIANGTTWLTATIMTGSYNVSFGGPLMLIGRVDTMSPALRNIIGPVKFIEVREFYQPVPLGNSDPWGESWVAQSVLASPDVYMSSNVLPIKPDEMRATTRLIPGEFFGFISNYDSNSNVYSATGDIKGSIKTPNFRRLSDDMFFGEDTISTFNLNAIVDETGTSQGGTLSWTGRIPSMGIPNDVVLMEGTPIEVSYYDGALFDFLIRVTYVAPELEAAFGPIRSFVFRDYQDPFPFFVDPWAGSWIGDPVGSALASYFTDEVLWDTDLDADGIANEVDNCLLISNGDQRDADGDSIGNLCDADFNNDCSVNFLDIVYFRSAFLSSDALADINGDGAVNFQDYITVVQQFSSDYTATNPSGINNACSSP